MSLIWRSALLSSLPWLDHAFLGAGERPPSETLYNRQRHTARVILDTEAFPVKSQEADGIIATKQQPVAVYTADCLPVLLADNRTQQVAAVHAGLNGALSGVVIAAIRQMCQSGASPETLFVAIGPAIGACCYELGQDKIAQIEQDNPSEAAPLISYSPVQPLNAQAVRPQAKPATQGMWFDLPLLVKKMILREGVPAQQIELSGICTYCMAEAQASYRRNSHFDHGYQQRFSWIKKRTI